MISVINHYCRTLAVRSRVGACEGSRGNGEAIERANGPREAKRDDGIFKVSFRPPERPSRLDAPLWPEWENARSLGYEEGVAGQHATHVMLQSDVRATRPLEVV